MCTQRTINTEIEKRRSRKIKSKLHEKPFYCTKNKKLQYKSFFISVTLLKVVRLGITCIWFVCDAQFVLIHTLDGHCSVQFISIFAYTVFMRARVCLRVQAHKRAYVHALLVCAAAVVNSCRTDIILRDCF